MKPQDQTASSAWSRTTAGSMKARWHQMELRTDGVSTITLIKSMLDGGPITRWMAIARSSMMTANSSKKAGILMESVSKQMIRKINILSILIWINALLGIKDLNSSRKKSLEKKSIMKKTGSPIIKKMRKLNSNSDRNSFKLVFSFFISFF